MLLPPNARFEVIGSFSAGSGLTIVQCRQVETMLPLIDMGAITLNVEVEHPLVFPFDAKAWSGPAAILRPVPGAWITDWAVFETKMDQLGGLIRTKITAGHADFDSDVYLAHAWGRGADGVSDNHDKARRIHAALTARGYRACFDEKGEVADDAATIHAIERSQLVLICLSKCYVEKLASPSLVDQCKKEFNHILSQRGESGMIMPVVIEEFTPTAAGSLAKPPLLAPPAQQTPSAQTEAELASLGLSPAVRESFKSGHKCSFTFVLASKLRAATAPPPRLQVLRAKHPDWLVRHTITITEVITGKLRGKYLIISHRWELPGLADENGVQFKAIQSYLAKHADVEFVWIECVQTASLARLQTSCRP